MIRALLPRGVIDTRSRARASRYGYIKDYDGGTLMECYVHPAVDFNGVADMVARQRAFVLRRIAEASQEHVVYPGLPHFVKAAADKAASASAAVAAGVAAGAAAAGGVVVDAGSPGGGKGDGGGSGSGSGHPAAAEGGGGAAMGQQAAAMEDGGVGAAAPRPTATGADVVEAVPGLAAAGWTAETVLGVSDRDSEKDLVRATAQGCLTFTRKLNILFSCLLSGLYFRAPMQPSHHQHSCNRHFQFLSTAVPPPYQNTPFTARRSHHLCCFSFFLGLV